MNRWSTLRFDNLIDQAFRTPRAVFASAPIVAGRTLSLGRLAQAHWAELHGCIEAGVEPVRPLDVRRAA